jgi:antitoxin (DNA-binding transcriptional repressor) of toxin-antitoxin stability system
MGVTVSPTRTNLSSSLQQVDGEEALVYTMRELNQQTARIMSEIESSGRTAFITRHGRFVATIVPLTPGQVESRVLAEMAREIGNRDQS